MISPEIIRRNLERVRARMASAAARAGRAPEGITLVAVTKSVGPEEARVLYELGVRDFGENRVQELLRKREALAGLEIRWHLIGHLQTNKVRKVAGATELLHSLDSLRLAEAVGKAAAARGGVLSCLVEVNVSGEASKAGVSPGELGSLLEAARRMPGLRLTGLMTMAPLAAEAESSRTVFRRLRELRDEAGPFEGGAGRLSMGMTQDFETAIEEGADWVRIGTALFEERG